MSGKQILTLGVVIVALWWLARRKRAEQQALEQANAMLAMQAAQTMHIPW